MYSQQGLLKVKYVTGARQRDTDLFIAALWFVLGVVQRATFTCHRRKIFLHSLNLNLKCGANIDVRSCQASAVGMS